MTENPRSRYKVSPGRTLSMPLVRFEHLGNMARIILARPNAGNAINAALISDLSAAVDAVRACEPRSVLITAEGANFSLGGDLKHLLAAGSDVAAELDGAFRNGVTSPSSLLAKDTSHRTVFPVFTRGGGFDMPEMEGAADLLLVPDPLSFKVLPWAPHSGWLLCDLYFADGRAVPFGSRQLCRRVLEDLNQRGFDYIAGLEVECHIFKLQHRDLAAADAGQPGTPPEVSLLTTGYQLLSEARYDQYDEVFEILRQPIEALGLPLRSLEVEFGPSQVEFTFRPGSNLEPADTMVLFRSAVKQICRRHGYHASFMCRPRLANIFSSGWHLHQSLRAHKSGSNAFIPASAAEALSPLGRHFLAGLLRHARASAAFATPTINGYRRYRPYTLAPDRAIWGRDNRGVMLRVLGGPGDPASRIENRIGEPAANPYLYMASQIALGVNGIDGALDPGPSADMPYETATVPVVWTTSGENKLRLVAG